MLFRSRHGFSLVEMLTVIAIIGVLAGLVFPIMMSAKRKAKETQCMSNLMQIHTALKQFNLDERQYPDFIAGPVQWTSGGDIVYAPGGTFIPLDKHSGSVNGKAVSLYPEYIDSVAVLKCPTADLNGDDQEYQPSNEADIVVDPMYALLGGGSGNGLRTQIEFYLYKCSSYDYQKPRGTSNDEVHYSPARMDASVSKTDPDGERQLRWRTPPADTVVTWCSYHRGSNPNDRSNNDIVLFLDGHSKRMPSGPMLTWTDGWRVK